jgi:hypothetical protein
MENSMNIELSEEIAEGIYSNLAVISHSNAEFVVDFILLVPNVPKAKVKSRIILIQIWFRYDPFQFQNHPTFLSSFFFCQPIASFTN